MSQDYFIDIIHFVNGFPETEIELDKLMSNGKFESLLIISDYININKMLEYINLHKYIINNGVYNFLLIKLSEFDYHNLLSKLDKETQQNLVQKYERMLTASHKTIESYIDDLCVRAATLGIEIPSHKKEKAMNIFRTILI